jgi:signal transduction histidine kinase
MPKIEAKFGNSAKLFSLFFSLGFLLIQLIVFFFYMGTFRSSEKALESIFSKDAGNQEYSLTQELLSLEKIELINCFTLTNHSEQQTLFTTQYKSQCGILNLIQTKDYQSLNGKNWDISYQVTVNPIIWYFDALLVGILGIFSYLLTKTLTLKKRREFELNKIKDENNLQIVTITKQVAHDIRSPLSALSMITGTLNEIPEEKRVLIRNATQRINDIANDLLRKGLVLDNDKKLPLDNKNKIISNKSVQFIPAIIDMIVSEKRMQYREFENIEIQIDLKDSFGSFVNIDSNELKRVISNLVNNSYEAFIGKKGKITIGVQKINSDQPKVIIYVKDNGKGIPQNIIKNLGQPGFSFGKESNANSGNGLGLSHAKNVTETFGGNLEIESSEGIGSIIKLIFPLAESPKWFAHEIDLRDKKYLISLDDDISIHQIWSGRLSSLGFKNIEHIKFQSGETFEKFINSNRELLDVSILLIDFELINQIKSGLDLIEQLRISKSSILVTSRYEEINIQERALNIKLTILPKSLAGFVPIVMNPTLEIFDWVLIDDDDLIHMTWKLAAESNNKTFLGFKSKEEFYIYKSKLNKNVNIYIDSNLGPNQKGEDLAKDLFKEGFKKLYLATGYDSSSFPKMDFVLSIVGKEPPIF